MTEEEYNKRISELMEELKQCKVKLDLCEQVLRENWQGYNPNNGNW